MTGLPRICLSMDATDAEGGLPDLAFPVLLELRLDDHPAGEADLARLLALAPCTLATCRPGSRTPGECGEVLLRALAAGATLVDLDRSSPPEVLAAVRDEVRRRGRGLVVSHHDFAGTPPDAVLRDLVADCFAKGGDVAKVACTSTGDGDNWRLLALYDGESRPLVAFGMGEAGRFTRLQALRRGAPFMYGSAGPGRGTAPGQWDVRDLAMWMGLAGEAS
jgi:3-dehydroquinate dehydratase type I